MNPMTAGLIAIAMWATSSAAVPLSGQIPPFLLAFIAFLGAGGLMMGWTRIRGNSATGCFKQTPHAYALAVGGVGSYFAFLYWAFRNAPPFEVNALNYLWPLLLVVCQAIIKREWPAFTGWVSTLMGFGGALLLFGQGGWTFSAAHTAGHVAALLAAIIWAVYSTATTFVHFPASFMGPVFLIISFFYLGLHFSLEPTLWPASGLEWMVIAFLALTRTGVAFWDYAMKKGNATLLASLAYLTPLFSSLLLVVFGFKPSSPTMGLAASLIVGGCLLANAPKILQVIKAKRSA